MSLVKEAGALSAQRKDSLKEFASSTASKTLAGLAVPAIGAAAYGVKKARAGGKKGFGKMTDHAGDEYHGMEEADKHSAKKYYAAIAKHSPTVAGDPIAAWNLVNSSIKSPKSYGPQTVEMLRGVETSGRKFLGK